MSGLASWQRSLTGLRLCQMILRFPFSNSAIQIRCVPLNPAQRPLFRDRERFEVNQLRRRLSQAVHLKLPFTLRYSRPVFQFLESLRSDATKGLGGLRHRESLPEGPDVEIYEVQPGQTAAKVREIVISWVTGGFCRLDEILILSPHSRKAKSISSRKHRIRWTTSWELAGLGNCWR
jgi:hypothetical protein